MMALMHTYMHVNDFDLAFECLFALLILPTVIIYFVHVLRYIRSRNMHGTLNDVGNMVARRPLKHST